MGVQFLIDITFSTCFLKSVYIEKALILFWVFLFLKSIIFPLLIIRAFSFQLFLFNMF
ncbi:unnamed protein product [Meloidogyne enterolobii]|uniref:Uncharacterized protein n=1 Tax=Meloidogyne enterolobii TaxID=390850 RepID=A0ACB0YSL2_MELEN